MPSIAIVGVGAIGGVLAGLLQTANAHTLILCTRTPLAEALTVQTPEGLVQVHAQNITTPTQATPVDWIITATKTYSAASAALWFPAFTGPGTRLAVVQNGVEHRENFAGSFQPEHILPVVIDVPAERLADNRILQRAAALIRTEASAYGQDFKALFGGTSANVELTDDFLSAAWAKLCFNCAGVINALTLKPAEALRDEALGQFALGLVEECAAVARAEGAIIPPDIAHKVLAGYRAQAPDSVNSLLADRRAHRATEIEARNGVILRRAALHNIPTPLNQAAVALFKAITS
jgi:2-dehydropantoate 2-reductase